MKKNAVITKKRKKLWRFFLHRHTSNPCKNHYNPEQRTVQLMAKRSRLLWLIIVGIIIVMIIIAALFLFSPSPQPIKIPAPAIISSTDFVAPTAPQPPSCTIAINGQKVPPASIQLQVMANTCIPGDITGLRVSVNGQQKGMPDASPGASGTFAGTSGGNTVMVVAKFGNGAESVVYEGTL
jgi:hypothetical protein